MGRQQVDELCGRLDHAFRWTRWAVEDLTDDEYFWEPTVACWSVRVRSQAGPGWGTGEWICEDVYPPPSPPPMTTIARRTVHIAAWTDVYRDWTFGDCQLGLPQLEVPGRAAEAVEWLHQSQNAFRAEVHALSDEDLVTSRPAHYGAELPVRWLVWTVLAEHIHHGAEIGVLRDLRRGHARRQPS